MTVRVQMVGPVTAGNYRDLAQRYGGNADREAEMDDDGWTLGDEVITFPADFHPGRPVRRQEARVGDYLAIVDGDPYVIAGPLHRALLT